MISRVVEKLFGRSTTAVAGSDARSARQQSPGPTAQAQSPTAVVDREEIIDRRLRICGYRFRPILPEEQVPQARADALKRDNVVAFAQRRMAVIPLRVEDWPSEGYREFITPNTIFEIEVPRHGGDIASWLLRIMEIKAEGARVGFDSVVAAWHHVEALDLADAIFVKPDDYSIEGLDRLIARLRNHDPKVLVVADGVHSWCDFRACLGMGAHYCLGSFVSAPDTEGNVDALPGSHAVLVDMLGLLRGGAGLPEMAVLAARDGAVAAAILDMAGCSFGGDASPATIGNALEALGRDAVCRWLAVSIFRAGAFPAAGV